MSRTHVALVSGCLLYAAAALKGGAAETEKSVAGGEVLDLHNGSLDLTCWAKKPPQYAVVNVYGNKVTPGGFTDQDGGTLLVARGDGGPQTIVNLAGGMLSLQAMPWRKGGDFPKEQFLVPHFDGPIVVHKPSFLSVSSGEWVLGGAYNGPITDGPEGPASLSVVFSGAMGPLHLNNPGNTWSGGLNIMRDQVRIGAAGALGRGPVRVGQDTAHTFFYSGVLVAGVDNSLASPKSITIEPEGALYLRSNESKPGKVVQVKSGGALINVYGDTQFQFDPAKPGQNFSLEKGSLLFGSPEPMPDQWPKPWHWMIKRAKLTSRGPDAWGGGQMPSGQLPSYDLVKNRLGAGDGLFGLYDAVLCGEDGESHGYPVREIKRSDRPPRIFGDDSKGNIWRGLGVPAHGDSEYLSTFVYPDVANEAPEGKQGICLYSQGRSWFKIRGCENGQEDGAAFNKNSTRDD